MDDLNPCLALISEVRKALESGESVRLAVRRFAEGRDPFARQCGRWLLLHEKGGEPEVVLKEMSSSHRRSLIRLLERGLRGEAVAAALKDFEAEIVAACRSEIDRHVMLLPFKLMIPLLLMIFPALMLLLFGPLLEGLAGFAG